ncbi:MAG: AI-2E family transporter [Candidatus Competibacteraceae bacterium]|nr:AI-2E family transporter [Candidatus Competibacteraceae bacterium]
MRVTESRIGWGTILLVILGWLLWLLAPVLTPFLIGAFLAYLGDPVADFLEEHGFSRTMAVVTVFSSLLILLLVLLLFLIPLLGQQFSDLVRRVPVYLEWLQTRVLPWLDDYLGIDPQHFDLNALRQEISASLTRVGSMVAALLRQVTRSSAQVVGWLLNLLLIPVVTFYLLRDWDVMVARVQELLPRRIEPRVSQLARESDEVLGGFLRGQFMVMLALGTLYSIGLVAVGLDFSLLIGMSAGLISFVPYLGTIVGVVVASLAALMQFGDFSHLLMVWGVFAVGQMIEGTVLTPWLVGDKIGLHPVAVIFAVLAGGHLFGFFGILLALPVASVIMVLLRHTHEEYLKSEFYDEK